MTATDDLNDVLTEMEAPEVIRDRAHRLLGYYEALGFRDFATLISETPGDDGVRTFESLWLFAPEGAMEGVLSEASDDDIDGAPLGSRLIRWNSKSKAYDFVQATPESRMRVQLWFTNDLWGEAHASGTNCDRLRDILRRYVTTATGADPWQPPGQVLPAESMEVRNG